MKILFSFYRSAITRLTQIAWRFGIMNLERSLCMLFRLRQPVAPYRCMIKRQEMMKWLGILYDMLDDAVYMLSVFSQINQIMPVRPVRINIGETK